jgi:titin
MPRAEATTSAFTYTVTSTGDLRDTDLHDGACTGTCTLRTAIEQANANCSVDPTVTTTIKFDIPGSGVHTITPIDVLNAGNQTHGAPLPGIGCPVVIDGWSQGGAGYQGPPLIELDGSVAAQNWSASGLGFGGNDNGSTVDGLAINRWDGSGIMATGRGGSTSVAAFTFIGNYIGTDPTGTVAEPNSGDGITIGTIGRATIGGTASADRNLLSGNGNRGVFFQGPNTGAPSVVQGNYIGTDITGTTAIPNGASGIDFNGNAGSTIGGTAAGAGNLVSGNGDFGISINGQSTGSMTIQGNRIGTQADGTSALGNAHSGILLRNPAGKDKIGGTSAAAANTIAFNGRAGVTIGAGTGHHVVGNSIHDNGGLAIDITSCGTDACGGVSANDPGDGDTGPNQWQNFPVLTSVKNANGQTTIQGTLDSRPNKTFTIDLYASPQCDDSGHGEGQRYLGSTKVTTTGAKSFSFTVAKVSQQQISATATDGAGDTSEMSACVKSPK